MQVNLRSSACILAFILCLSVKNDLRGQESFTQKVLFPKLVSDEPIPKSISLLLNALGSAIHPEVKIDQATQEDVSGFIEQMLHGLHLSDLRVEKPVSLSNSNKTSFESANESSLQIICALSERADLPFSIREKNTFVFEPVPNECVEYNVSFAGYTNGQETFKVTRRTKSSK